MTRSPIELFWTAKNGVSEKILISGSPEHSQPQNVTSMDSTNLATSIEIVYGRIIQFHSGGDDEDCCKDKVYGQPQV